MASSKPRFHASMVWWVNFFELAQMVMLTSSLTRTSNYTTQPSDTYNSILRHGVHFDFLRALNEFCYYDWMLLWDLQRTRSYISQCQVSSFSRKFRSTDHSVSVTFSVSSACRVTLFLCLSSLKHNPMKLNMHLLCSLTCYRRLQILVGACHGRRSHIHSCSSFY